MTMSALRVELFYERECLSAIAFALEGDPRDYDANAETVTLDVSVAPAA
jgi:hypothetical protein